MRYCRICNVYTHTCLHLERRKKPRGFAFAPWLERHGRFWAYLLLFGTLAYVVGGVWGLW